MKNEPNIIAHNHGVDTGLAISDSYISPLEQTDFSKPDLYINRELSWLKFNQRVLNEAKDKRVPLLERIKFLAIVSSNLDEFYMKRIGLLKFQVASGITKKTIDGTTPQQQLDACNDDIFKFLKDVKIIYDSLLIELSQHQIKINNYPNLELHQQVDARSYFKKCMLPLITPLAIDTAHPFPFISNLSLNLLITLQGQDRNIRFIARIKIPRSKEFPRFFRLENSREFVMIEDIIINNLDLVFPGLEILNTTLFRILRNAASSDDDKDQADLLESIESHLHERKFAPVVKLEIASSAKQSEIALLASALDIKHVPSKNNSNVYECDSMIGLSDLMELTRLNIPKLLNKPHKPVNNHLLSGGLNIFEKIRNTGTILLQHPYESFQTSVERFVYEASIDPKVVAIKKTLYRTSSDTRIVEYLINAAQRGKHVVVIVELQARFDEAENIKWTNRLEKAGIHVKHGILGLKTHCKTILVIRREDTGLRRYAHVGTGNYHAGTARLYSDFGLLTCDSNLTKDLTTLFNHLTTGWDISRCYTRILTSPHSIKNAILKKIDREIDLHTPESPGLIRMKSNALEDADITAALYRASQAGVTVQLMIRDICRLRPGIQGISENITVISIIGRFLEHSRIYYFRNGGNEEFYIGSADLMKRNLEKRVEVIVPIEDFSTRQLLQEVLEEQLLDRRSAWEMNDTGNYIQRSPADDHFAPGCQEVATQAAIHRSFKNSPDGTHLTSPIRPHSFKMLKRKPNKEQYNA